MPPTDSPALATSPSTGSGVAPEPAARMVLRPDLVVCDECDAVHARVALAPGQAAHCRQCGAMIGRHHRVSLDGLLALTLGALLFLLLGNVSPIVTLDLGGVRNPATLPAAIAQTWVAGERLVAVLAAATALAVPLAVTLLRLHVLLGLSRGRVPPGFRALMHVLRVFTRWSMVEVFLLGTLVAIVRSAGMASVVPGVGIFSYAALTLLLTSITASGLHHLWQVATDLGFE